MRRHRSLPRWLLLTGVGLLAACGGLSDEEERRQLADDLVAESGGSLDAEQAECVAAELQDTYGEDSFRQVLDAAEGGQGEDDDSVRIRVIDIFAECDALEAITDTGS